MLSIKHVYHRCCRQNTCNTDVVDKTRVTQMFNLMTYKWKSVPKLEERLTCNRAGCKLSRCFLEHDTVAKYWFDKKSICFHRIAFTIPTYVPMLDSYLRRYIHEQSLQMRFVFGDLSIWHWQSGHINFNAGVSVMTVDNSYATIRSFHRYVFLVLSHFVWNRSAHPQHVYVLAFTFYWFAGVAWIHQDVFICSCIAYKEQLH